jgi:hypothetical protein
MTRNSFLAQSKQVFFAQDELTQVVTFSKKLCQLCQLKLSCSFTDLKAQPRLAKSQYSGRFLLIELLHFKSIVILSIKPLSIYHTLPDYV